MTLESKKGNEFFFTLVLAGQSYLNYFTCSPVLINVKKNYYSSYDATRLVLVKALSMLKIARHFDNGYKILFVIISNKCIVYFFLIRCVIFF